MIFYSVICIVKIFSFTFTFSSIMYKRACFTTHLSTRDIIKLLICQSSKWEKMTPHWCSYTYQDCLFIYYCDFIIYKFPVCDFAHFSLWFFSHWFVRTLYVVGRGTLYNYVQYFCPQFFIFLVSFSFLFWKFYILSG